MQVAGGQNGLPRGIDLCDRTDGVVSKSGPGLGQRRPAGERCAARPSSATLTRGAALTEAGTTFRDHAVRAIAEIDTARETILPAGDLHGRLRIAAPLSFGPTVLAPVFAELARRHPRLHVHTCYSDRFVDLIGEGFDCGIRVGYLQDSNLIARRVGPIRGKLVASPEYIKTHGAPQTPEELLSHQALMQGTETWQFTDGDKTVSIHPQGRFKADDGAALAVAATAGSASPGSC